MTVVATNRIFFFLRKNIHLPFNLSIIMTALPNTVQHEKRITLSKHTIQGRNCYLPSMFNQLMREHVLRPLSSILVSSMTNGDSQSLRWLVKDRSSAFTKVLNSHQEKGCSGCSKSCKVNVNFKSCNYKQGLGLNQQWCQQIS